MSAPSPAPWVARNFADDSFGEIHDANGLWVARVHSRNGNDATDPECVANALLMAASPKMLEGLKLAVARLARVDGGDSMVVSTLLDLILGATGESFDVEAYIADEDEQARGCL